MARRSSRRTKGFTLLEVLVALLVFSMASIVLVASYLNILNAYKATNQGLEEDRHVQFCRDDLMKISDLTTAQAGDEFDTADNPPTDPGKHVKWTADIEPTNTTDVFTVTLTVVVSGGGADPVQTVDTFTLLRPTWSQPTDRNTLRQSNVARVMQLQGRQAASQ